MSKTAMKLTEDKISITLYDPLVPMLKNTGTFFEKTPDMANGVFEHIPFQDEEFDAVLCGYSLRDAINLRIAISEIHRVLKKRWEICYSRFWENQTRHFSEQVFHFILDVFYLFLHLQQVED